MKKKITTIIGTRPEIIKMYPIIKELDKNFDNELIWSGQHYDFNMVKNIFLDLNLRKPNYFIKIKDRSKTFFEIQKSIHSILEKNDSKAIIYHGDTFTTLASALVSRFFFPKILNVHIEGGFRSLDNSQTEEQVRFIADHISQMNFVQRINDKSNLDNENCQNEINIVGNSVKDSIDIVKKKKLNSNKFFKKYSLKNNDYIYCTIHRSENVDDTHRLKKIVKIIKLLSKKKKVR
ncbi:UDP-N-acetylglucosamine 2-epimerase [Candidatus Pelagibacter sp.]|nr:UDP-N-acetylglucosamine 2-epimerase [Candidatus Pelagibacter sp.]